MEFIFSHILGDYAFQSQKMAFTKSSSNSICAIHCFIYTLCHIVISTNLHFLAIVFSTHFLIDRYSLISKYLKLINGRTFESFLSNQNINKHEILSGSFTAIVYTVLDNGVHLMCNYYAYKFTN